MPKPRHNEKRSDFVSRCIPIVLEEGTAKDQKQATAICHSMFDRKGDSMKTNQFEHLVTNLTANGVRYDMMEGKEYLVVPMVMITTGVHAGSNGPLYYPEEELSKTPAAWNAKPIVVYHPQINGRGVSACDPEIFTSRRVGLIMNTRYEDGKLKAEAWLDPSRMDLVDPRIREHIDAGKMMELSTGLFTDNEEVEGEWRGKRYVAVARNYRPDHLALLPDKVGACSIKDGAGFLRLNERQQSELMEFGADLEQAFEEVIQNAFQKAKERVSQASQEPSKLTLDTAFESVLDRDHYFENEQEIVDNFLWRSHKQRKWYFANRDKVKAAERKAGKGKSKFGGGPIRGGEEPGAAPKKGGGEGASVSENFKVYKTGDSYKVRFSGAGDKALLEQAGVKVDGEAGHVRITAKQAKALEKARSGGGEKIDPNRPAQKTISGRRQQGKVNIADAAASLETAGYKLGRATTDLSQGTNPKKAVTYYEVTQPDGSVKKMTAQEVKQLKQDIDDWSQGKAVRNPDGSFWKPPGGDDVLGAPLRPGNVLEGHNPTAVIRWMGKEGFTVKEASQALKDLGVKVSEATIKTQLGAGKRGQRGAPADLSPEQAEALRTAKGGGGAPKPKSKTSGDPTGGRAAQYAKEFGLSITDADAQAANAAATAKLAAMGYSPTNANYHNVWRQELKNYFKEKAEGTLRGAKGGSGAKTGKGNKPKTTKTSGEGAKPTKTSAASKTSLGPGRLGSGAKHGTKIDDRTLKVKTRTADGGTAEGIASADDRPLAPSRMSQLLKDVKKGDRIGGVLMPARGQEEAGGKEISGKVSKIKYATEDIGSIKKGDPIEVELDNGQRISVTGNFGNLQKYNPREPNLLEEISFNSADSDLFQSLQEAVTQNYGPNSFVEDIYDSEVVFYNTEDSRHYRQSYVLDQNDLPQLNATPPVAVEAGNDHPSSFVETDDMAKRELVNQLVSNELTQWQEEDRDLLMSFSEPMLRRMLPVVNAEEDEESEEDSGDEDDTLNDSDDNEEWDAPPQISDGNKPGQNKDNQSVKDLPPTDNQRRAGRAVTAEDYINNAPPEIREVLQAGLETAKAERRRLINTIVANENNPFDPKFLATKSIQELRGLAQLAKGRGNAAGMPQEEELPPMFLGAAGGPVGNMLTNNDEPEPLIRPSLDYSSAS